MADAGPVGKEEVVETIGDGIVEEGRNDLFPQIKLKIAKVNEIPKSQAKKHRELPCGGGKVITRIITFPRAMPKSKGRERFRPQGRLKSGHG